MKKMLILLMLFLNGGVKAQTFGVKAGYTHARINVFEGDEVLWKESKYVSGFNLGGTVEFAQSDHFSVVTGIGLTTKGAKGESQEEFNELVPFPHFATYHYKLDMVNLEIPLQVKFAVDMDVYRLYAALGAYGGVNVFLRSDTWYENKYNVNYDQFPGTRYDAGKGNQSHNHDIKALDYGALATLGIAREHLSFSAAYSYGLANLARGSMPDDYSIRNTAFEFSIGYTFGAN